MLNWPCFKPKTSNQSPPMIAVALACCSGCGQSVDGFGSTIPFSANTLVCLRGNTDIGGLPVPYLLGLAPS